MVRMSRASFSLDRISRFYRAFLSLLFLAICLFAVVPQMALVDSDDDGLTDLSAIVIGAGLVVHPTSPTCEDERSLNSRITVASALDANWHLPFGINEADPIFRDRHSVLASLCLLRC